MPNVTPFLWFAGNVEEAVSLYTSIFKNSRVLSKSGFEGPRGQAVKSAQIEIAGQRLHMLDVGPERPFPFTEAISLFVDCDSQAEIDELWERLSAGGQPGRCGWLKDKFGVSWQIVPRGLGALLGDPDPERARRAREAMLSMSKLDLAALKRAHAGDAPGA